MIIDNHVHVFPDQASPQAHPDTAAYALQLQGSIRRFWGRWVTSHTDPKYIPGPAEDVGFYIGKFGRYHWKKHGEECWLQRGPVTMEVMEHSEEQMLAHMDFVGVDMVIIQAGYIETNLGRDQYYAECIKRWPDRFIGVAELDYDLTLDDKQLEAEVRKLTKAVEELGHKGLFLNHARTAQPVDDPRFEPLWQEVCRLGIPAHINTGLNSRVDYYNQLQRLENVLQKFPELVMINAHIGSNIRHPKDPEYVDNPREYFPLFKSGRFYLEVGYVLSYENWRVWGREFEYPYPRHIQLIKAVYENFGAEVLIWGSDMPWAQRTSTYRQNLDSIMLHTDFMADDERALITGGNLARILNLGK